jgi:hypothetical protein
MIFDPAFPSRTGRLPVHHRAKLFPVVPRCVRESVRRHYAARSVLNVSAGGTSEFFRGALTGIAFGRSFGLCGSVYGQGRKYLYFRAGKSSLAPRGSLVTLIQAAGSEALATCPQDLPGAEKYGYLT